MRTHLDPELEYDGFNQTQLEGESNLMLLSCMRLLQSSRAEKQLQRGRHRCPCEPRRSQRAHFRRPARFWGSAHRLQRPHARRGRDTAARDGQTRAIGSGALACALLSTEMGDFHFSVTVTRSLSDTEKAWGTGS